jgi:lipid-A-disaccharide synthase
MPPELDPPVPSRPIRVAMVAGELSGDALGAGLIRALRARRPDTVFEGIGGERMTAAGLHSWVPMERLAVMGLVEVLGRLRELLRIRRSVYRRLTADPADVFIGIDAPDFNLGLAYRLHAAGLKTVHYVSPQVWAWRQHRVRAMARGLDMVLTLFSFEAPVYQAQGLRACFVGHPMADEIAADTPTAPARAKLGLDAAGPVLAMLPGSRSSEAGRLAGDMLSAATRLARRVDGLIVLLPCASNRIRRLMERQLEHLDLDVRILGGRAREALAASDVVLTASGTATLEAALIGRPMVVLYRMNGLTFRLLRRLVRVPHIALPNLLCGERAVPEYLQAAIDPERVADDLFRFLQPGEARDGVLRRFRDMHRALARGASERAADAVLELLSDQDAAPTPGGKR